MNLKFLQQSKGKVGGFKRVNLFLYIIFFFVFVILFRFFSLQIVNTEYYKFKAQGNTERVYVQVPPRGLIFDRNGVVLASNRDEYSLSMVAAYVPKQKELRSQLFNQLAQNLSLDIKSLETKYRQNRRDYRQYLLKEALSSQELIYLREHKDLFPFLNIVEYSGRVYPYKEAMSHILGYIGSINKKEYDLLKDRGYRQDSIIGKAQLEKEYDAVLRGEEGQKVSIADSLGRDVQMLDNKTVSPVPGKNLVLSIDINLQEIAAAALEGREGAILVTKVATGEVVALASAPGYDANSFTGSNSGGNKFGELLMDPGKPFVNRVIQGLYSPGSIFKILVALSALEDGKVDPYKLENVSLGYFKLGNRIFKTHSRNTLIDMPTALARSDNVYFYRLGYNLGYASILEHAINVGFKGKTGIDLPNEVSSFIPTPEWKEKRFNTIWVDGDTVNISIGQGFLLLSPIGVHNLVSVVATGKLIKPRLVWQIKNPYSSIVEKSYKPELISPISFKEENLNVIREGLAKTTSIGTARYHQALSKVPIAAKTGTAQTSKDRDNAWAVTYGPIDKPLSEQYGMTVVLEYSGYGGAVSLPISSILYNYLEGAQTKEEAIRTLKRILPPPPDMYGKNKTKKEAKQ